MAVKKQADSAPEVMSTKEIADALGGEVVSDNTATVAVPVATYDDAALRDIVSFDDAIRLATLTHGETVSADQVLGDGFTLLPSSEKGKLVGVPMVLLEWSFYPGDFGDSFAAIRLAVRNQDGSAAKYIVNDGSTGIAEMLKAYTAQTGRNGNMFIPHGLRESEYMYCQTCKGSDKRCNDPDNHKDGRDERGQRHWNPAKTYYIDTSAA